MVLARDLLRNLAVLFLWQVVIDISSFLVLSEFSQWFLGDAVDPESVLLIIALEVSILEACLKLLYQSSVEAEAHEAYIIIFRENEHYFIRQRRLDKSAYPAQALLFLKSLLLVEKVNVRVWEAEQAVLQLVNVRQSPYLSFEYDRHIVYRLHHRRGQILDFDHNYSLLTFIIIL